MRIVKLEKMRSQDKKLVSNYEVCVWKRYLKCVRVCVCVCVYVCMCVCVCVYVCVCMD